VAPSPRRSFVAAEVAVSISARTVWPRPGIAEQTGSLAAAGGFGAGDFHSNVVLMLLNGAVFVKAA